MSKPHPNNVTAKEHFDSLLKIELPQALIEELEAQAHKNKHSLQDELAVRLGKTLDHEEALISVFQKYLTQFETVLQTTH